MWAMLLQKGLTGMVIKGLYLCKGRLLDEPQDPIHSPRCKAGPSSRDPTRWQNQWLLLWVSLIWITWEWIYSIQPWLQQPRPCCRAMPQVDGVTWLLLHRQPHHQHSPTRGTVETVPSRVAKCMVHHRQVQPGAGVSRQSHSQGAMQHGPVPADSRAGTNFESYSKCSKYLKHFSHNSTIKFRLPGLWMTNLRQKSKQWRSLSDCSKEQSDQDLHCLSGPFVQIKKWLTF